MKLIRKDTKILGATATHELILDAVDSHRPACVASRWASLLYAAEVVPTEERLFPKQRVGYCEKRRQISGRCRKAASSR